MTHDDIITRARAAMRADANELERLRAENAALKREAWTWSKACEAEAAKVAKLSALTEEATKTTAVGSPLDCGGRRWDRRLWGVEFTGSRTDDAPMLIGQLWATEWASSSPYPGEPTRALLFTTRELARQWCAETMAKWRDGRQRDDCVRRWRVLAVRVRETVQVEAA